MAAEFPRIGIEPHKNGGSPFSELPEDEASRSCWPLFVVRQLASHHPESNESLPSLRVIELSMCAPAECCR